MPLLSEKLRKQLHQPWFGGSVGALLTIVLGLCLLLFPVGKGLRDWSYDLPFLLRSDKLIDDVMIVYLDEKSYPELGQDPAAFDRSLHARLVKRLQADGARMAVFDILFIDTNRPITASEREFAQAIQAYGKVVLGAQFHEDKHLGVPFNMLKPPIDLLRTNAAGWGVAKIHRDTDFAARSHHPGDDRYPSLAWKAAELAGHWLP